MLNYQIQLIQFTCALLVIYLLVQTSSAQSNNYKCKEFQFDVLPQKRQVQNFPFQRNELKGFRCFTFQLPRSDPLDKFLFKVEPLNKNTSTDKQNFFLFLTTLKREVPEFVNIESIMNMQKGEIITSNMDGFLTKQPFPKLYYLEKEGKIRSQENNEFNTYYLYMQYFSPKFKDPLLWMSLIYLSFERDYNLSFILNPEDKDLCNGHSNSFSACKCDEANKITLNCNVDVMFLRSSNEIQTISDKNFSNYHIFLYLNQTDLYSNISADKKFKLEISKEQGSFLVFDKQIEKEDVNDILPIMKRYEQKYRQKEEFDYHKKQEYIIQKESNDRIFFIESNKNLSVSFKMIEHNKINEGIMSEIKSTVNEETKKGQDKIDEINAIQNEEVLRENTVAGKTNIKTGSETIVQTLSKDDEQTIDNNKTKEKNKTLKTIDKDTTKGSKKIKTGSETNDQNTNIGNQENKDNHNSKQSTLSKLLQNTYFITISAIIIILLLVGIILFRLCFQKKKLDQKKSGIIIKIDN